MPPPHYPPRTLWNTKNGVRFILILILATFNVYYTMWGFGDDVEEVPQGKQTDGAQHPQPAPATLLLGDSRNERIEAYSLKYNPPSRKSACPLPEGEVTQECPTTSSCNPAEANFAKIGTNEITVQCPEGTPLRYTTLGRHHIWLESEPNWRKFFRRYPRIVDGVKPLVNEHAYWKNLPSNGKKHSIPMSEFINVQCGHKAFIHFNVTEKPEVRKRATGKATKDALNIVAIHIDGVSRPHFMKQSWRTRDFIAKEQKSHQSFIFNRYSLTGPGTPQNMRPLFIGTKFLGDNEPRKEYEWIWKQMEEFGYVHSYSASGGMLWANCYQFAPHMRHDSLDHLMPTYLRCANLDVALETQRGKFKLDAASTDPTPSCFGGHHTWKHHFDFVKQYLALYPGLPKFIYTMLDECHYSLDGTCHLDTYLKDLVQALMKNPRTAIILFSQSVAGRSVQWGVEGG